MLQGTKILDLTRVLAGPYAAMTLGDLGADVIKVERPGSGDESRGWGPPFDAEGESAYFLCANRNKLSVALDLNLPEDRSTLLGLVREADVVLDNFKRGTLEARGIDPKSLLVQHPRLIWCTISGFGPHSDRLGYDFVVQAESGWMAITGEPDGTPMKIGVALADLLTAKDATIAVLGALVARDRTVLPPEERQLDISLSHSATAALINVAQNVLVSGADARRWGNAHPNLVPYQLFDAADRPVVIAVGNDGQWRSLCDALSLEALAADTELATNRGRLAHRSHVVDALATRVRRDPAAHLVRILSRAGVPCGVVRSPREALGEVETSAVTGVAPSVPGTIRRRPPRLGEHSELIRSRGWKAFD